LIGQEDLSMLRRIKIGLLAAANHSGLSRLIGASTWRNHRLLILCYHGVTDGDLHQWNPSLFMDVGVFRRRMELLRQAKCHVIGLGEALERLQNGSLPPRSVVLTFDDGFADFYHVARPILREFGFPATVYLTTYYMFRNLPVFDPALDYLLWKGRGRQLDWPEITPQPVFLDATGHQRMARALHAFALKKKLSATQKDALLEDLAKRLGLDYDALRQSRALNLLNEDEARQLSAEGVDLQLHTHRHRTSAQHSRFLREIVDNREGLAALGSHRSEHFCYPSGVRRANDPQWLDELGIKSAATCEAGYVAPDSDRHSLPRVVDCSPFTETEFLGWLHGTAALLPHRGRSQEAFSIPEETEEIELLPYASALNR
jgi:peptidoglycan/xylan/chitin deacetylase (PgdA/CDA1 family)